MLFLTLNLKTIKIYNNFKDFSYLYGKILEYFIAYYEKQWVEKLVKYCHILAENKIDFNQFYALKNDEMKTTSSVES